MRNSLAARLTASTLSALDRAQLRAVIDALDEAFGGTTLVLPE